ncbi:MAG: NAD(+) diphosphatase [Lachnospira sp.]
MIQDIEPKHLYNEFKNYVPESSDIVFCFKGNTLLSKPAGNFNIDSPEKGELVYPRFKEFICALKSSNSTELVDNFSFIYLFSVDEDRYFLALERNTILKGEFVGEMADSDRHSEIQSLLPGYEYIGVNSFRKAKPKETAFAAITAYHLYGWYRDNRFCGRCGSPMRHDDKERMLRCDCCKNMVYPKISPAVIVAVTDKDRILLTKYAGRAYKNYALIAGFTEIGESAEQTVAREVMEEVGLKVKNIRYYKSQPWGLSGSQLYGYYCELDGNDEITLDKNELSIGTWVSADELDIEYDGISLTNEMICVFKKSFSK